VSGGAQDGSRGGVGELFFGRIDPIDGSGRTAADDHLGEGAVAAADVEPSQTWLRREPV
jgi:hypothetical protein